MDFWRSPSQNDFLSLKLVQSRWTKPISFLLLLRSFRKEHNCPEIWKFWWCFDICMKRNCKFYKTTSSSQKWNSSISFPCFSWWWWWRLHGNSRTFVPQLQTSTGRCCSWCCCCCCWISFLWCFPCTFLPFFAISNAENTISKLNSTKGKVLITTLF